MTKKKLIVFGWQQGQDRRWEMSKYSDGYSNIVLIIRI